MSASKGHLFILSAPSGAGKTTLCRAVMQQFPDMRYSISYTTRPHRKGEKEGTDYHFISIEEFKKGIETGKWAEWALVHGNYYGTCGRFIDTFLSEGNDVLLDIDIQGTIQILQRYPDAVTVFIMPPSLDVLRKRLEARGTDSPDTIAARLARAQDEIAQRHHYSHIILNNDLSSAISEVVALIKAYRARRPKYPGKTGP